MFRRYKITATSCLLFAGVALTFGGCSDSTPPSAPAASQPAAATPEPAAPAKASKGKKDPLLDMGVKEKRELRRKEREAAGQTP